MKNLLLSLTVLTCLVTGCDKNDSNSKPEGPKTDVTFQFSNFEWEVAPISKMSAKISDEVIYASGDTLRSYAKYFYYRAYNSNGVKVSEKNQTSQEAAFGTISDVLDPGTYTVIFAASNKPLGFSRYDLSRDHLFNVDNGYWYDTFFKKIVVTVGSEPASHAVKLDRIVGALEVTFLDVIPVNANKITISVEREHGVYELNTGKSAATGTKTKEFVLTAADKGQANRKFMMHILNHSRGLRITIKSFDAQGLELASKTVEDVWFFQNRKTILRGNLSSTTQFTVTVDPVWGDPTTPIIF